ncbi:NTP transferase domain-containing protein [Gracilimonas tropica]|uniref:phosphocholine cytidylyltransferase family protein n=1 Tax=Gracilimonas tropica TaxID=454600 RepID=UPI000377CA77|nr:NTP transferase domain-containing protein [Gracilimonas tropica]
MTKKTGKRTGVILAAGFGSRLAGVDDDTRLKPLTSVNGIPLIYRTIQSLETAGCSKVVIVLGFGFEEIKKDILGSYEGQTPIVFAHNEQYKLSNGISVLTAESHVEGDFILTMADHILSDKMMRLAKDHIPPKEGATLLVDYKVDEIFDMDDATKVYSEAGKIKSIGKTITNYNCIDTGVFVCTHTLMNEIRKVYDRKGDASLSDGIQALADRGNMHTLDIGEAFWQDVDTPEMLQHAEKMLQQE